MNELITKEFIENGVTTDEVLEKFELKRYVDEWFDTFKYLFKTFCEENGFTKWETDYFTMNYIGETMAQKIDIKKMKETDIYVANADTGEMEQVNAYEFFCYRSPVKAHVTFKEKK